MKRTVDYSLGFILIILLMCIISYSDNAKVGATNGIELCQDIIIPALLPILIILGTLINSKVADIIDNIFGGVTKTVFGLQKCCTSAIVFGLIGGYPTGAILTHQLYKNGQITTSTAQRILRFNLSGGMAFIVTAVGEIWLCDIKKGWALFLITIMTSLLVAIIERQKIPNEQSTKQKRLDITSAITTSVESATKSILIMCSFIILFSAICNIAKIPVQILPIIEITNGLFSTKNFSFELMAFYLNFGGLCIHFQLLNIINDIDMKYFDFLFHRLLAGGISFFLGKIYLSLFPDKQSVYSNISQPIPKAFQVNIPLSIVFVIGCIVLVLDIHNKKCKYV